MKVLSWLPLLAMAATVSPAAAQDCVAKLGPGARLIYDRALPKVQAGETIRDALTEVTKSLIYAGRIALWNASPAAHAASDCLEERPR